FGFVQLICHRILRGSWQASGGCILVGYSIKGNAQLAINGYGDAVAPNERDQMGCPIPGGRHRFFANAGVHQCYYVPFSHGLLETLVENHPPLARLRNIPDDWYADPWQCYRTAEEDFRLLEAIRTCDRSGIDRHRF